MEVGVLDNSIEKSMIPTSLEDAIAIIRRECSTNCTNAIVELMDARIALQLEELDFEIREEGNKTNLYKIRTDKFFGIVIKIARLYGFQGSWNVIPRMLAKIIDGIPI